MRRVLASHIRVSEETNLYIVSRNSQIIKLEDQKKLQAYMNKQQLDIYKLQKAFEKERKEFRTKTFRIASAKSPEDYIKLLEEQTARP